MRKYRAIQDQFNLQVISIKSVEGHFMSRSKQVVTSLSLFLSVFLSPTYAQTGLTIIPGPGKNVAAVQSDDLLCKGRVARFPKMEDKVYFYTNCMRIKGNDVRWSNGQTIITNVAAPQSAPNQVASGNRDQGESGAEEIENRVDAEAGARRNAASLNAVPNSDSHANPQNMASHEISKHSDDSNVGASKAKVPAQANITLLLAEVRARSDAYAKELDSHIKAVPGFVPEAYSPKHWIEGDTCLMVYSVELGKLACISNVYWALWGARDRLTTSNSNESYVQFLGVFERLAALGEVNAVPQICGPLGLQSTHQKNFREYLISNPVERDAECKKYTALAEAAKSQLEEERKGEFLAKKKAAAAAAEAEKAEAEKAEAEREKKVKQGKTQEKNKEYLAHTRATGGAPSDQMITYIVRHPAEYMKVGLENPNASAVVALSQFSGIDASAILEERRMNQFVRKITKKNREGVWFVTLEVRSPQEENWEILKMSIEAKNGQWVLVREPDDLNVHFAPPNQTIDVRVVPF